MGFLKLFLLSVLAIGGLLIAIQHEVNFEITIPLKEENYKNAFSKLETFGFWAHHPNYISHRLISEDKEKKIRVFEFKENVIVGPLKNELANVGNYWQANPSTYVYEVSQKLAGFIPFISTSEFSVTKNEIKEVTTLKGPLLMVLFVKSSAAPIHEVMVNNWSQAK